MLLRVAALALIAAFSAPIAASAMTASPAPMKMKMKTSKKKAKGVTNKVPGGPGFTGSSPLGTAEKKKKS